MIAREIALSHHEKWDGGGYPHGLKKESIPLSARIVALADTFDVLISKRSYKDPYPVQTPSTSLKASAKNISTPLSSTFSKRTSTKS